MTDVAAGRQSLAANRWEEALEHFRGGDDDPQALEGMGLAYWWLDDADAPLASRERAFRLYRDAGDPLGAARGLGPRVGLASLRRSRGGR